MVGYVSVPAPEMLQPDSIPRELPNSLGLGLPWCPPRLPTSWLGGGMGTAPHLAALWHPDAKLLGPKNVILLSITEKNQNRTA